MDRQKQGSIFTNRAAKHINDFIRILVKLSDGREFYLMVDRRVTIEYVAKQIEAEVASRNLGVTNLENQKSKFSDVLSQEGGIAKAIDIFQLYDAANLAIPFTAKVADVLKFDDVVLPMTSIEEDIEEEDELSSFIKTELGSVFHVDDGSNNGNVVASKMDDRLYSVLHNISSMHFFNEFCLQEYSIENVLFWIECEVFKSIRQDDVRRLFAKHLFLAYICPESPLRLNVDEEIRSTLMALYKKEPTPEMFDDIQLFVYILIKKHAYSRFEKSALFKRFLEFKDDDRYTYTQGKIEWDYDVFRIKYGPKILENIKGLIQMMEDPTSNDAITALDKFGEGQFPSITSALFRHRVLKSIMDHYFPESAQLSKGYFDPDSRNNFKVRQLNVLKQKKLRKFFGAQITEEQMKQQTLRTSMIDTYVPTSDTVSIISYADKDDHEFDKKKKASKLTGFFGDQLPKHQMKAQHLVNPDTQTESAVGLDDEAPVVQVALLDTINELPPEEKAMLTKRAKKLLMMLGETLDGREVHASLGTAGPSSGPVSPDTVLTLSDTASAAEISIVEENDQKMVQKQRLDKLSHFLGHRIAETDIVTTEPQVFARPLTVEEKKIYQKKAGKLEQLLGSAVPADTIVNYSQEKVDIWEDLDDLKPLPKERNGLDSEDEDDANQNRKNKLARLRKLRKMLGISDIGVLTDKVLREIEESIRSVVDDPEDRALLEEDLKQMKARVSEQKVPRRSLAI